MNERFLTRERIDDFSDYLYREEKSTATREKYLRDTKAFCVYAGGESVAKDLAQRTVNKAALFRLQSFFRLRKWVDAYAAFADKRGKTTDKNIKMALLR